MKKNERLSKLRERKAVIHFGLDDDLSDADIFRSFLDKKDIPDWKNTIYLYCNSKGTVLRYVFIKDNTPYLRRKHYSVEKLPWPCSKEEFEVWSKEKKEQLWRCIYCPTIEENICNK